MSLDPLTLDPIKLQAIKLLLLTAFVASVVGLFSELMDHLGRRPGPPGRPVRLRRK